MTKLVLYSIGMVSQARINSLRFPGKVLLPIAGTNLLGWILQRLKNLPWPFVIATSDHKQDNKIVRNIE